MPGLVPGMMSLQLRKTKNVDGREKPAMTEKFIQLKR
jgi:hypothetical protein